ncbi:transcriptional regulator [Mannheimia granulomatis]|uniref:Transcriptional regulator n=1 Tax=Mannheimia granulomatis TaxID=85402 RepID=A0A011MKC9_9PAST|nr:S24 family peptidase [Mannheimia granulomatis]EXI62931.1 transcriptional regulator [Mannheimia granulomatis]QLB14479.1 transcriptional regulator [Mannheimia granulomatis]RGE48733.1 transcriptional regulator [Mannheimia granulomatis]
MASVTHISAKTVSHQPIPLYRDFNSNRSVKLDLNSLCIKRPTETFFIHVKNPNLLAWGIELDDLLIVENTDQYLVNDLLVIEKNGEYKFYQFFNEIENTYGIKEKILFSLDVSEPNLRIKNWDEIEISGVIMNVVHQMRTRGAFTQAKQRVA